MTAFSEADLDRLADFVGGALDGTPEADDVRHLVTTDTAWAEAYAALVAADATMRDELHALGAQAPAVPLEVQQRLDAALTEAITAPPADAPVVDLDRARQARRQRRGRWIAGLAAAAAVIVCGGVGVQVFRSFGQGGAQSAADLPHVAAAPDARSDSAAGGPGASGPVISSGRDYGRGTLGDLARGGTGSTANLQGAEGAGTGTAPGAASVTGPLSRLAGPAARGACLAAITREYGGQVSLVDYAAFEGQPALVVVLDGTRVGAGKRLVVAVGPNCGIGGAIADERYRTTVP
ncbi:hypothetical protein AB0M46_44505 [Dactylosporangium sp. NPDC051485]|uniref:hypothetical protein n=1 Tax=Dactylosporangium sp. NPDC051485 TaxID=3154846 RepID=UPI0034211EC9